MGSSKKSFIFLIGKIRLETDPLINLDVDSRTTLELS